MLKINLLPEKYRKDDRSPMGAYLMVAVCTLLAVSALSFTAFMYVNVLKEAETQRDIAKQEFEGLERQATFHDELDKEKTEYMKRSQVIKEIEAARILWTKKLDQLLDVVSNQGEIDRHWVWLKELKVRMSGARDSGLELKGYTVGDQYEQLSNFNEDLKQHPLFQDNFCAISNPVGSIVTDKEMVPCSAIEFSWNLKLSNQGSK